MARVYFLPLPSLTPDDLPILKADLDQIENTFNGNLDDSNLVAKGVTAASIADATLTSSKMADGVGAVASGTFTGDGTANRTVAVGFQPRHVLLVKQDDGTEFTAIGSGTAAYTAYWRLAAGTQSSGTTDWAGIVATGFKSGSNAASLSNKNGVTYFWVAYR